MSDFFLDFLGCQEGLNAKEQTQTLVQAVEDYVAVNQLDAGEKQKTRNATHKDATHADSARKARMCRSHLPLWYSVSEQTVHAL